MRLPFSRTQPKEDAGRELPGWRKRSFALPYRGGMIWFEHLDGLGPHTDLARKKLALDRHELLSPSGPGLVCVVGANLRTRRRFRRTAGNAFLLAFLPGLEQAKEWLIPAGKAE